MASFSAVLDACVLIPAPLRDTLLRAAGADLYRPHWSDMILDEVERNLVESGLTDAKRATRLIGVLRREFPDAVVTGYNHLIGAMQNHPKDRHVLAAAVVAHAQVIVTENVRDFRPDALQPYNVQAQSPDDFLLNLFDLWPALIPRLLREQADDLRNPPHTIFQVLDKLGRHVPRFATLIRMHLESTS